MAMTAAIVFGSATVVLGLALLPRRWRVRAIDIMVVGGIGYLIVSNAGKSRRSAVKPSEFAQAVDLSPIKSLAVQQSGRIKSLDSVARTQMRYASGRHQIAGQEPTFTYLDIMLRPEAYENADVIYVKKQPIRQQIADKLAQVNAIEMSVLDTFVTSGLISPSLLRQPVVTALLDVMEQDVIRTKRPAEEIRGAMARLRPEVLAQFMRVIPPASGKTDDAWHLGDEVWGGAGAAPGLDAALSEKMGQAWSQLRSSWREQNATGVNDAAARLAALVRSVSPTYPETEKLKLENWYFRWNSMTWIWVVYLAAIPPLLMSVIYHWKAARGIGLVLFVAAFGLHTSSLGLRWHISGRIPNSNMFEAITAATWLAGVVAMGLEFAGRRSGMRSLFALGAAVAGMTAMMCNHFMPTTLSSDIENIMPVLHDVWLYIHTNMIILSYGLIAMAAVSALLYLRYRLSGGAATFATAGGAGTLMMASKRGGAGGGFVSAGRTTAGHVLDGATMVLMELSFVTLWTGLVMGAIWADHSWGRPWGWDPKEVFALNTFIVFLVLVHVRFKVKDKGLWTAILAVVGCGVMLFNWIVINFVITGLHSYA
ncbi:MAG: cytochrome c biogenesis protein CcsA [Phycisphaerales bacterium]|nr:cytochrome c biogenesis protein CcsA [Phycisphaerales bacterium]